MRTDLDFALDVAADVGLELFDVAFGLAERLGEFAVQFGQDAFSHFLDGDGEFGGLAGDFNALVVIRELELENLGFASLQAAGGFFEFRQHAALAEHEREVFGRIAMFFEGRNSEELVPLGEIRTPSIADLFVAKMQGVPA